MTPSTDRPYGPGDLSADELKQAVLNALASAGVPQTELMASLAAGADYQSPWERPAINRRHPRRETPVTYRVKVELQDSSPPIWRRLDLRSDLMLPRVHLILQEAMGWANSHLHEFVHASSRRDRDAEHFGSMDYPDAGEMGELDEADVRLDELAHSVGDKFLYLYDFGDGWSHRVTVEKVLEPDDDDGEAPDVTVVAGRRACPPGGLRGDLVIQRVDCRRRRVRPGGLGPGGDRVLGRLGRGRIRPRGCAAASGRYRRHARHAQGSPAGRGREAADPARAGR